MKAKYIIGAAVIVIFLVWGASAFMNTTVQYVSIEEAAMSNRTVQVMGKIDFDAVNYNSENSRLEFAVYDAEATDPHAAGRLDVVYYGVARGGENGSLELFTVTWAGLLGGYYEDLTKIIEGLELPAASQP